MNSIYLDHHATTPLDARAFEAMRPFFCDEYGNASSVTHDWGRRAAAAVEEAREAVASLIGARSDEIVFTAGATESNNLAIKGGARAYRSRGKGHHIITTAIEHKAVLLSVRDLRQEGFEITVLDPGPDGVVTVDAVRRAIRPETVLVSVMAANSEIGTLQPIPEIGALCSERGVLFHSDATQAVGKLPINVRTTFCDMLSMSAHKFYGPKGVGALFIRDGVEPEPLLSGGGQERGLRSGTLNVPGIVGMGAVARICADEMESESGRMRELRNTLWREIERRIPDVKVNGCLDRRLPANLSVCFLGCEGPEIMESLSDFALSSGSACQSAKATPSAVLTAIGCTPTEAHSTVRFGLGKSTDANTITRLVDCLEREVARLRQASRETAGS